MSLYVISDANDGYIYLDKTTGKYSTIRNYSKATRWDDKQKAEAILNNSLAKRIRKEYKVICINESMPEGGIPIQSDAQNEWEDGLNALIEMLSNSGEKKRELGNKLSNIDKEIVDIEHYIEFGKFNAYQGWKCFKMLQERLVARREYKNKLAVMGMIEECKVNGKAVGVLSNEISGLLTRQYRPRALPELFEASK